MGRTLGGPLGARPCLRLPRRTPPSVLGPGSGAGSGGPCTGLPPLHTSSPFCSRAGATDTRGHRACTTHPLCCVGAAWAGWVCHQSRPYPTTTNPTAPRGCHTGLGGGPRGGSLARGREGGAQQGGGGVDGAPRGRHFEGLGHLGGQRGELLR